MATSGSSITQTAVEGKGKSKAENPPQDVTMDEDDNSSDEETGAEEEPAEEPEEDDVDNMEEISTDNIINDGRRTRGKQIDFAKADACTDDLDEDEEDDEDFEEKEDDDMRE